MITLRLAIGTGALQSRLHGLSSKWIVLSNRLVCWVRLSESWCLGLTYRDWPSHSCQLGQEWWWEFNLRKTTRLMLVVTLYWHVSDVSSSWECKHPDQSTNCSTHPNSNKCVQSGCTLMVVTNLHSTSHSFFFRLNWIFRRFNFFITV